MEKEAELFQSIIEQINDGVYFVDKKRRITYWNQASERITGFSRERVLGQFCMANILMHVNESGELLCMGRCPLAATLEDGQVREAEVYLHHSDGHRVPVAVRVIPIMEDSAITGAVEIFTENISLATALKRIEELHRAAMLDELTRIGNRRLTKNHLESAMKDWQENRVPFGILMIDLDNFKKTNDEFGHQVGDRVLQMVALTLSNNLRAYDFVGRWGGEEFMVVVLNVDDEYLNQVSERLRMLVETSFFALNDGHPNNHQPVRVTVSMGGAIVRQGENLEQILDRADRNLYLSKASGRNRVTL